MVSNNGGKHDNMNLQHSQHTIVDNLVLSCGSKGNEVFVVKMKSN